MHDYVPFVIDESYGIQLEGCPMIVDDDSVSGTTSVNGFVSKRVSVDVEFAVNVCQSKTTWRARLPQTTNHAQALLVKLGQVDGFALS